MKRQPTEWGKVLVNNTSDKRLNREHIPLQLNNNNKATQLKNG